MLKLGTIVKDNATGLKGMLTIFLKEQNGGEYYCFQPQGTNPDTGATLAGIWAAGDRIDGAKECDATIPDEILGSQVRDEASGFCGMATGIKLFINGCIHISVQAKGHQKSGDAIAVEDFDIRRLSGPAIKAITEAEKKSEKDTPSPVSCPPLRH